MPSYTYEITCTCDEIGESPCPAHARENSLQNKNLALMAEIEEWKNATGLMDSRGDPDGVTPKDLYNEINHLRQQQEKQWGIADEARAAQYEKKIKRAIDKMKDVECPYCGHGFDLECEEHAESDEEWIELECEKCENNFVGVASIRISYETHKAPCLNGSDHDWKIGEHDYSFLNDPNKKILIIKFCQHCNLSKSEFKK